MGEDANVSTFIVKCLENEGVEFVFGIPGEENIHFVDALGASNIRFILARSEQGASFMADMYGRVTGKAGVCTATLGPGAINLLLGVADAQCDSTPVVAIVAQVGLNRIYKETHQFVDLVRLFEPVTKRAAMLHTPPATAEMVRAAFKTAQTERPGATLLAIPQDVAEMPAGEAAPLAINHVRPEAPSPTQIARAAKILGEAKNPVVLAGHGLARAGAQDALVAFAERLNIAVANTFHGKGAMPDDHPNALGTVGFMVRDYANFGFDAADVIVAVGYELQEFPPAKINPDGTKRIIYIHRFPAEVDANFNIAAGIEGDIAQALDALAAATTPKPSLNTEGACIKSLLAEEIETGRTNPSFPLAPQRIVADVRTAMGPDDIVLADTGAIKMWFARLYPTYRPNTCLISNGLATMAFALPGALGVKLANPDRKVLAVMGDGSFMMNSQEIETALREKIPFVILIFVDDSFGLIKWKMDLEMGHHSHVDFKNPDFVAYAESFGAKGYRIEAADELLPTLNAALKDDTVSVIACPVDYTHNNKLTDRLGELTQPI